MKGREGKVKGEKGKKGAGDGGSHALLFHHLGMFGTRLIAFALSPLNRKRPRPAEL